MPLQQPQVICLVWRDFRPDNLRPRPLLSVCPARKSANQRQHRSEIRQRRLLQLIPSTWISLQNPREGFGCVFTHLLRVTLKFLSHVSLHSEAKVAGGKVIPQFLRLVAEFVE